MNLHDQKLTSISVLNLLSHWPRPVGANAKLRHHGSGGEEFAVILRADSGATGWGLLASSRSRAFDDRRWNGIINLETGIIDWARLRVVQREYADLLVAEAQEFIGRPLDELFDSEIGVIEEAALPLDFALHDLAGKILGVPVYKLIGERGERAVPCYDTMMCFEDLDPPEKPRGVAGILKDCTDDYALGYRAFKLKIGRGNRWMEAEAGLARDIEVTRAVRDVFPDCAILVDANNGYTGSSFLRYLEAVIDCNLFWIEEPFLENDDDLTILRKHLRETGVQTLIAEGEGDELDENKVLDLARKKLIDVALFDVGAYGLTAWRRVMPRLEELGVLASPHTFGSPLKTLYTAQLAAGLGNVPTIEGILGTTDGVDASGYRVHNGILRVPETPGFGIGLLEAL